MAIFTTEISPERRFVNDVQSLRALGGSAVYFTQSDPTPEAAAMSAALELLAWDELAFATE